MSTIKRKVFKVLSWTALIAGLVGFVVSALIVPNALRVHFVPLTPIRGANNFDQPVLLTYDGYIYDFNAMTNINLMFPNGTVIGSNTSLAAYPLGLYANSYSFAIIDLSINCPQSAIDWSKANNQPLFVFTIIEAWFNLPLGGQNVLITPVTIYNLYPVYPQ
ncbi:MAG: hypothetical protein WED07_04510 [Candidatus Freyarchaeum deiterrae]